MIVILLQYSIGLFIIGSSALAVLAWRRMSLRRALLSLLLSPLPLALAIVLWHSHSGNIKTLGNLIEFTAYGAASGTIPFGQFIHMNDRPKLILGELLLATSACVITYCIYRFVPTLPETSLG